jgi:hypothetical protein
LPIALGHFVATGITAIGRCWPALTCTAIMVFKPMSWVPQLPDIPDTTPLCEFMFEEKYGRLPIAESKQAYTCGLTGKSISAQQQKKDVDKLSRALAKEFGWEVNQGTEYDKVAGIFALNTVRMACRGEFHTHV